MKKTPLLLICVLLLLSCRNNPPDVIRKQNELEIRMGVNGNLSFRNIRRENARTIDGNSVYTKYGHSEISFNVDGEIVTYAMFSIPADDQNAKTFFNFVIEKEDKKFPNFILCAYNKESSKNISFYLRKGNSFVSIMEKGENVAGKKGDYLIKASGKFEKFKQENLIVIGSDSKHDGESMSINDLIISSTNNEEKWLMRENTAYIVAYPWRTIKVKIEGGDSDSNEETIKWANSNVFNQAIVRLELTTDSLDYDAKIIITDNPNTEVIFYDEDGNVYRRFFSERLGHAEVSKNVGHYIRFENGINYFNGSFNRTFAYAVARLLGVSAFHDDSDKTLGYNLLNTNFSEYVFVSKQTGILGNNVIITYEKYENDKAKRTHLSFRQWNQLHIRGRK